MKLQNFMERLPNIKGVVVVMSGGMDSAISAKIACEKYGAENVHALTYFYGQKQSIEIEKAKTVSSILGLKHHQVVNIDFLGDMVRGISSNIVGGNPMPTIKDILGDPTPPTEVPNRNAILLMIAVAYAEANNLQGVVTGVQAQDQYAYWDTTPAFISSMNSVLQNKRKNFVEIIAPFQGVTKSDEINALIELDGNVNLLSNTITCYDPTGEVSCGVCPSCAERIKAFMNVGLVDPILYAKDIPWK